jgi:hypothetical protein
MHERVRCPDCEADCQAFASGWRCPWATATRNRRVDGILACGRPYDKQREVAFQLRADRK